ncbi:hypothetical protein ACFYUR_18930 [Micromonospora haikouensis]|uniref:hypothetical protein n=1 Tax=Micromonospora haikouensis TaxID=686309 RepID=UPI0036BD7940
MIKRAPRPDRGFLILANETAREPRMSYRASGILHDILSRPDNWTATAEHLAAARPDGEGVKAIRTALKELEKVGYLKRQRVRGEDGRFSWVQTVYDVPVTDTSEPAPDVSAGQTTSPKPPGGFPPDGNRLSKEEPRRSTREEDVSALHCTTSVHSVHSGGGVNNEHAHEADEQEDEQDITSTPAPSRDWRTADRELFRHLVGSNKLTVTGKNWTPNGTFPVDAIYRAFWRRTDKPIRWPGRLLEKISEDNPLTGVEDWLAGEDVDIA